VCKCFKGTFREDSITKKMWGCFFNGWKKYFWNTEVTNIDFYVCYNVRKLLKIIYNVRKLSPGIKCFKQKVTFTFLFLIPWKWVGIKDSHEIIDSEMGGNKISIIIFWKIYF
jgi:hypothetical protein